MSSFRLRNAILWFQRGKMWSTDERRLRPVPRFFLRLLRRMVMAVELFLDGNLSSHASALTYSSILGAVPILAIVFAISRGFGFDELVREKLLENVRFTPEMTDVLMDFVNSYLERAKGGVFIGVGLVMLFYTLINLTSNIETSFNTIWRVKSSRNIYRRAVDYISVFFLLPIVIVITSGLQIFLVGATHFLPDFALISDSLQLTIELTPYFLAGLAFAALYKMMPNTDVQWSAVFLPGMLAGIAFQGLQWFYIHSQVWISSYNAIYGSFAAIPLFMLWMQLSWTICLFGAQLSYANQMEADFAFEKSAPRLNRRYHDSVVILIMARLCQEHNKGIAVTARNLAIQTGVPISLVNAILYELMSNERNPLVSEVVRGNRSIPHFEPATNINNITVGYVMNYLDELGDSLHAEHIASNHEWPAITELREAALLTDNTPLLSL